MDNFFSKLKLIIADKSIRNRVLFTLGALIIFRLLANIPIPGIDVARLQAFFANSQFLGLLNVFSGGGLSNLSLIMLGVGPYITASIIMQLLTMMVPKLKAMYQEEGEAGRAKFAQYSRLVGVPLAFLQAFGFLLLLQKQGIVPSLGGFALAVNVIVIAGGSVLLMWIGELITEFGIGNGVSLIIFAGIVARIPTAMSQALVSFDASQIPVYIGFLAAAVAIIFGVVIITEGERPIPVTYAKRVRGMKVYGGTSTYLPLRLNQAGVIPIIFALSILLFPQMIFNFLSSTGNATISAIGTFVLAVIANKWIYALAYFILVFLFTYFYTAVTFDPDSISENLQKNGAFIPGVRPGQSTSAHIYKILNRLTLFGALFLGIIAVLPLAMQALTGIQSLAIGGTALLIVVSVVLDLMKKVDAQISMREY
ncbi:MAG: preprotein translocase subunit SecY [Candidatus Pacebacteria bacterium]|nr:preprotein translocase subunit SecY [Candidatus Paceibacterota bacterium]MDD5357468.1 preprotein translocase subunit SecY [Candidatus Paceibacterota bacterium]